MNILLLFSGGSFDYTLQDNAEAARHQFKREDVCFQGRMEGGHLHRVD